MPYYLLGIDIGTSSCKIAVFSETGKAEYSFEEKYDTYYPKEGWAEQQPDAWWEAVCRGIKNIFERKNIKAKDIMGVGVAGQSWSAIAINEFGEVLLPTPIWTDTRAEGLCRKIEQKSIYDKIFEVNGNVLRANYALSKVLWYRENIPETYKKIKWILQSNSFIVYRLTDVVSQDVSQGYGFGCFDMRKLTWDLDIIKELKLSKEILPPIAYSHKIVGHVSGKAAKLTGLIEGTPVVAGGLDAACGAFGVGVIKAGQTQEQGGQAGGMSVCMDGYKSDKRLILGAHVLPELWLLQGGTTGGGSLRWLQEIISKELTFEQMSDFASTIAAGSEGLIYLPYMAGERSPIWNSQAKGVYFGLNYSKNRAHMIRATMEGVAYALRHNLEIAMEIGAEVDVLRATGGASKSETWIQIKADCTGKDIEVLDSDMATTRGAALLAGLGIKMYEDAKEAMKKTIETKRIYRPDEDRRKVYEKGYEAYLKLYDSLRNLMQ